MSLSGEPVPGANAPDTCRALDLRTRGHYARIAPPSASNASALPRVACLTLTRLVSPLGEPVQGANAPLTPQAPDLRGGQSAAPAVSE